MAFEGRKGKVKGRIVWSAGTLIVPSIRSVPSRNDECSALTGATNEGGSGLQVAQHARAGVLGRQAQDRAVILPGPLPP